jgi:hypothetical protein
LRFSNTSFWHYGAKPLKIGEQSYTFLIFFFENGFFQKSPYVLGIWVLLELAATAAAPVFWGCPAIGQQKSMRNL